jgi:hypothetical protein
MDGDKERFYHVVPKLWHVGKVSPQELKFLLEVYVGMAQPKKNINYPFWYYQHEPREILILDESTNIMIKNKKITRWTLIINEKLSKFNLGTIEKPQIMLISTTLFE